ncbi:MAG: AAA-like domain-containing protein [Saprospiraceae bacterium]
MAANLSKLTFEDPDTGREFKDFLLKRRPFQRPLALLLSHAANAGDLNQNRLDVPTLRHLPEIDKADKKFRPTDSWYAQLAELTQQLDDSQKSNNIWQRKKYFEQFNETLNRFYETTLRESPRWNKYYIIALERWKKSAADKLRDLELEAQTQEPICPNIYRGGEKLDPALDKPLFLGRDDLRDTFKSRVLTAQQMPLFFIQGQRRTGKSSLLNFLPDFLDRGFRVVQIDLQTLGKVTVQGFFQAVYQAVWQTALPELPENWVEAWQVFKEKLEAEVAQDERKLVLAIDEYEELHRALHEDPEQGAALLAAVRSFSQSQNRVVLLFAGADFMSELSAPNWNEYFVQTVTLDVDYLSREDSKKLIGLVGLRYEAGLPDLMYEQTQGHPCLLQKLCQEIVANANKTLKNDISRADYDTAVQNAVLRRDNGVIDVFWGQFCKQRNLKDAVRQILRGETPADKVQLLALEDHGFIVRDGEGWRMRVPLFTAWLERYEAL